MDIIMIPLESSVLDELWCFIIPVIIFYYNLYQLHFEFILKRFFCLIRKWRMEKQRKQNELEIKKLIKTIIERFTMYLNILKYSSMLKQISEIFKVSLNSKRTIFFYI